ncbi:MAG: trigger factor [Elusimicrobiota bacterium]|jgi:trigger factor
MTTETRKPLGVKVKQIKEEGCALTYEVQLSRETFDKSVEAAFSRIQSRARIPGFRPGRAPAEIVRKQFSDRARADAADELVQAAVPEALKSSGVQPISSPMVTHVHLEDGKPFAFELVVEVPPKFEVKGYKGLSLTRHSYPASPEEIVKRLDQLREGNARLETSAAQTVGKEHYVLVDYELLREGKRLAGAHGKQEMVDMSAQQTVEGFTEGLLGARRGEDREFPVKHGRDKQAAVCRVRVTEIKEKHLPALDDDFAKDMGFDGLAALKAKIGEMAVSEGADRSERELLQEIDKALLAANKFAVPSSLTEHQLEQNLLRLMRRLGMRGLPEAELEKLREKLRSQSEDEVRLSFILASIAVKEKLVVGDEDFAKELEKNLTQAESEEQKKDVKEFFEQRREGITSALRDRKTVDFIRSSAKLTEK